MQHSQIHTWPPDDLLRRCLEAQEVEVDSSSGQHEEVEVAGRGGLAAGTGAKDHCQHHLAPCAEAAQRSNLVCRETLNRRSR